MLTLEGQIVNFNAIQRSRIEIGDDGIITGISGPTGKADLVFDRELIFPGFVDLHVHARECVDHSEDYKEDFTTAGQAAINGGVVAFAEMPNNPAPPVDEESYRAKYQLAKKCAAEVVLYAGIGYNTKPLSDPEDGRGRPLRAGAAISRSDYAAGDACPYKVYISKSVGDLFFNAFDALEQVLEKYRGQNISFHCEDPEILRLNQHQSTHELRRPPEAEVLAIEVVLRLIKKYGLKGKICHLSTQAGLRQIVAAKKKGVDVTCEVTPHHLYFDSDVLRDQSERELSALDYRRMLQVNPPIRLRKDRLALVSGLKNGDIDFLATDHAPHTITEKRQGISGLPQLDTLGLFTTWLMQEQGFTPQDIARVCSFNPGKFFNQFTHFRYGQIAPGFVGSLTVIEMSQSTQVKKSMLKTKTRWSPFEGVTFPGRVKLTVIKGKIYNND